VVDLLEATIVISIGAHSLKFKNGTLYFRLGCGIIFQMPDIILEERRARAKQRPHS
jgi:hypothetical protein